MCDQQSLRSACAYAQSDQRLCKSLEYSMIVKLLTEYHLEYLSLTGGCRGSSEPTLVKMSNCWKSHAAAQMSRVQMYISKYKSEPKTASEYKKEIPQSHTTEPAKTDPRHREEEPPNTDCHKTPGRQLKPSNQLSLPHQDYCKTGRTKSTAFQNKKQIQNLHKQWDQQ